MNTKILRLKILDLAFRGKLVPQDLEEEPASELLEKIWTEKERLVRIGEIRRDKKDSIIFRDDNDLYYERYRDGTSKCIEDELPYELPDGWAWERINDVCIVNPRNDADDSTIASFVPMAQIEDEFSNHFTFQERPWREIKSGFTHFQEGDVGLAKITPCLENRKSVVFTGIKNGIGSGTTELHIFRPIISSLLLPEYLLWYLKTERFINDCISAFSGAVGQQRIGKDFVASYLLPVPPTSEQCRIIHAIHQAFKQISSVESDKSYLETAIAAAKLKILSLAIHGKLVPQDPDAETGIVLLERILAEKEARVLVGKNKPEKIECTIKQDESPFDLPEGWVWVRSRQIAYVASGQTPDKSKFSSSGIPFIKMYNIKNQRLDFWSNPQFINEETHKTQLSRSIAQPGDLLMNIVGPPLGKLAIIPKEFQECNFNQAAVMFRVYGPQQINEWLYYYFSEMSEINTIITRGSAGQVNISLTQAKNLRVPLPPLAEQQRIIMAIKAAFEQLDNIADSLS